jgi:hypothetical protein
MNDTRPSGHPDELIPCDVAVAPGSVFGAGCNLAMVLASIRQRQGIHPAPHFRRQTMARILPPEVLADTAALVAWDVAQLQDRPRSSLCMRVTIEELETIVRDRLKEMP